MEYHHLLLNGQLAIVNYILMTYITSCILSIKLIWHWVGVKNGGDTILKMKNELANIILYHYVSKLEYTLMIIFQSQFV